MSAAAHALPRGSSSSTATGRCGRSAAAAPARSGSRATSGTASTWRSRSSRARGRRPHRAEREAEAAARLRHERCLRAYGFGQRLRPRLHRLRVRRRPHAARGDARRRARATAQAVEAAAQMLDGARARARARHRPPRRQAVERPARRGRRDLGAAARLRPRAVRRGRDADRRRGRARARSPTSRPSGCAARRRAPASDVWAVGILLWEALAGKHPFWGVPLHEMAATIEAGCAAARSPSVPTCRSGCSLRSSRAVAHDPAQAAAGGGARRTSSGRALAGGKRATKVESVVSDTSSSSHGSRRAALAGTAALAGGTALPFYPTRLGARACGGRRGCRLPLAPRRARARARGAGAAARQPSRSGSRCCTACSRSPGWLSPGGTHAGGLAFLAGPAARRRRVARARPARAREGREPGPPRRVRGRVRSPSQDSSPACAAPSCRSARVRYRRSTSPGRRARSPSARSSATAVPLSLGLVALALAATAVGDAVRRGRRGGSRASAPACSPPRCCSLRPPRACRSCSPPGSRAGCWRSQPSVRLGSPGASIPSP